MKKIILLLCFITISGVLFAAPVAKITYTKGKVEILNSEGKWVKAQKNMKVPLKTMISTGFKSAAIISLGDSNLTVSALTRMKIEELQDKNDTRKTALFLQTGRVRADVNTNKNRKHDFKFRSPVSTASVRGTSFTFTGRTLMVHSGAVSFTNRIGQRAYVARGQNAVANTTSRPDVRSQAQQGFSSRSTVINQVINLIETQFDILKTTGSIRIIVEYPE
jgi:hypothetical protein